MDFLNRLRELFDQMPVARELLYSVLLVPAVVFLRAQWLRLHFRQHPELDIEQKRRVMVGSRNAALFVCLFGLFVLWSSQIQTFALSMVALAAATVLATKELIMCLSGSLLRVITKQYSVGDYIEINRLRGRVVDINLLNTLMMEIGPNPLVGQLSGRTLSFPNSLLLSHTVERDNILGYYVVHTFDIPVPLALDSDALVGPLFALLEEKCAPFAADIARHFDTVQTQKLFITPAAQPRISRVPHDDKVYHLVVRFASPVPKRLEIQQALMDEFIRLQYRLLQK